MTREEIIEAINDSNVSPAQFMEMLAGKSETKKEKKKMEKGKMATVVNMGTAIVLPEGMGISAAISELEARLKYDEQTVQISEHIKGFVWDAAYALSKAMERIFGHVMQKAEMSFFGPKPPQLISLEIAPKKKVLVPWGSFSVPGVDGTIATQTSMDDEGNSCLVLRATVKRKHEEVVKQMAEMTREILAAESIYRGKAIKIKFYEKNGDKLSMPMPKFLELDGINEEGLIYSADVTKAITTSLFTPIERAEDCRKLGVPLKRGVLLSGPYGTGKTLAAYVSAKKAVANGFTFIYCHAADEFADCVKFAHDYQPAVIFCEDIDRATEGERTADLDDILNIIDGIESKTTEIIVVLTTNHVEKINPAMLRPGRLDAVINVLPPDAEAVRRLIKLYAGSLLADDANLEEAGERLAGTIPAVIRECVERSKLAAIKYTAQGLPLMITGEALTDAAVGMQNQLELLKMKPEVLSAGERIGGALEEIVSKVVDVETQEKLKKALR